MTALRLAQKRIAAALLDPDRDAPREIARAGRRFAVYRNNVRISLTDGLVARFPLCRTLVGDAFFRAMAARFIELCPPRSPVLASWGDDLPEFIELFPPARSLPYLADCARLEIARTEAHHAADATPVDPAALATIDPDSWDRVRLTLHPSVRLLASPYPVGSIWRMHAAGLDVSTIRWQPEEVMVSRPFEDTVVTLLPPAGATFLAALAEMPVGSAVAHASRSCPGFDLVECLTAAISRRIVVAVG